MKLKNRRRLHRGCGLIAFAFLLFYTFTGILLNHRKFFNNFLKEEQVKLAKPLTDSRLLSSFIKQCQAQIGDAREPSIIIIRDRKTIDFRYDRHGSEGFILNPAAGTITRISKEPREPWHALKWLHVAYLTSPIWVVVSDLIALIILLTALSGLYCFRYQRRDVLAAVGGLLLFMAAVLMA